MEIVGHKIIFSDGAEIYASFGVIGIGVDGHISHGYDGYIHIADDDEGLTDAQLVELSEYMIREWQKVKIRAAW